MGTLEGDAVKEAKGQIEMDKVMAENTSKNKLGIQRSVFNARNNPTRIISDKKDNTIRNWCTGIMIGFGLVKTVQKMNEFEAAQVKNEQEFTKLQSDHNKTVDDLQNSANSIDQSTVQEVADGEVTNAAAQAEHAIVHEHGVTTTAGYRADDAAAQIDIQNVASQSTISANNPADRVRQLSDVVKAREGIAADYAQASNNLNLSPTAPDHTAQVAYTSNADGQARNTASFLDKVANVLDNVQNMTKNSATFQKVQKAFLGPVMVSVGAISHGAQERAENKKEKEHNKAVKIESDKENEEEIGQEI